MDNQIQKQKTYVKKWSFVAIFFLATSNLFAQSLYQKKPIENAVYLQSTDSISFSWNAIQNELGYFVDIAENVDFINSVSFFTSNNQLNIENDFALGENFWRVRSSSGDTSSFRIFSVINLDDFGDLLYHINTQSGISLASGDRVSEWSSLGSLSINATQGNNTQRPEFFDNHINNQPAVKFGGASGVLHGLNLNNSFVLQDTNFTFISVFKQSSLKTLAYLFGNTNPNGGVYSGGSIGGGRGFGAIDGFGGDLLNNQVSDLNWGVNSASYDKIYLNSLQQFDLGGSGLNGLQFGIIGNRGGVVGIAFHGFLAETLIFNEILSDSSRLIVENHLKTKFIKYPDLGNDVLFCNNEVTLEIEDDPAYSNVFWSNGQVDTNVINVTEPGKYWVGINAFGHQIFDTIEVKIPDELVFSDTMICLGDEVVLNTELSSTDYTFEWFDGSTDSLVSVNEPTSVFVSVDFGNNCIVHSDTFFVSVDSFSLMVNLGNDTSFCAGNSIELSEGAPIATEYLWNTGDTTETIEIFSSGIYSAQVLNSNNCVANDSILINIIGEAPLVDFEADTVCLGDTTSFSSFISFNPSDTIDSILWDFEEGFSTLENPKFQFDSANQYSVSLSVVMESGCSASVSKTVNVNPLPLVSFSIEDIGCVGVELTFESLSQPFNSSDSIIEYNWNFGDGNSSSGQSTQHIFQSSGVYEVSHSVISLEECSNTISDSISIVSSATPPSAPNLLLPLNGSVFKDNQVLLQWQSYENFISSRVELATDSLFLNVIFSDSSISTNQQVLNNLGDNTYYWRVINKNVCNDTAVSKTFSFTKFTLDELSPLALWIDINDTNAINITGTNSISLIRNKTIVQEEFFQNNNALRPLMIDNQALLNFNSVANFNGDQIISSNIPVDIKEFTAFFLRDYEPSSAVVQYFLGGISNGFFSKSSGNNGFGQAPISGGTTSSNIQFLSDQYALYRHTNDKLFLNDQEVLYEQTGIADSLLINTIGARPNLTQLSYTGNIAEMIIFNATLNDSLVDLVNRYLRFKYAPPVNLGPDIIEDYSLCEVVLDAQNRFLNYTWSTGDDSPSITVKEDGIYWVEVTDVFGFVSSDTVEVSIPTVGISDLFFCENQSTIWETNLNGDYTFLWSDGSTDSFLEIDVEDNYYVSIEDTLGCVFLSDTLLIAEDSFESSFSLGVDTSLCIGNTLSVINEGDFPINTYNWSTGDTTSSTIISQSGIYWVEAVNENNCNASDSINISILGDAPLVDFTFSNACQNSFTDFEDLSQASNTSIIEWQWDFGDGNQSSLTNPTNSYSQEGDYTVILSVLTDEGCSNSNEKMVLVNPSPSVDFFTDIICAQTEVTFFDASLSSLSTSLVSWDWSFDNGLTSSQQNPTTNFSQEGIYSVSLTVTNNLDCQSTVTQTIEVFPALSPDFNAENLCFGDSIQFLDATPSFSNVEWLWNFGQPNAFSFEQNP